MLCAYHDQALAPFKALHFHDGVNLTLGLPVVESLLRVSPIPLDCHLMIDDPDRWAPAYAEAGAQSVTFHIEAAREPATAVWADP